MTAVNKREKELRKRLNHFLSDLAILGSLQGFRYFQPWLRGREELLLTVVNEDQGWFSPGFPVSAASSLTSPSSDSSSSDAGTPPPGEPPPQAPHQQSSRNGEAHLLPASPSEREIAVPEMNCTLFLLAGYAKYGRPYAWIRSNHERLVNIGGTDSLVRDTPMKLKSITDWCSQGTRVWDIERFLVSGAIINFLEMLLVYTSRDQPFYDKVMEEVDILRRLHIRSLWEVQKHRGTTSPSNQ
ncbi:uncharacterized protein [Paramormyrops kingsleyae]|uniref:uncharacterized protein isoform X3 n=1 Tax=Paramormyrops kingsleyae TaxID=1676925 RepID=UPI000CD6491B|nr:uncharacterized protein LOC111854458 isoform X3 [Paramormyrops kingsleyae]